MYWNNINHYFIYNIRTKEIVAYTTSHDFAKRYLEDRGFIYMIQSYKEEELPDEYIELLNTHNEYGDNPLEIVGMGPCYDFMTTVGEEPIVVDYAEQIAYDLRRTFTEFMHMQERFLKTPEEERLNDKMIEDFLNYLDVCEDEKGDISLEEIDITDLINFQELGKKMIEMGLIN